MALITVNAAPDSAAGDPQLVQVFRAKVVDLARK
jgi:hypothetical protein